MADNMESYPVQLNIEYAGRSDRLTTFFRVFLAIPIVIILGLLSGPDHYSEEWADDSKAAFSEVSGGFASDAPKVKKTSSSTSAGHAAGLVFLPTVLMILFRQKYPRWWFDWNVNLTRFALRVASYTALLRDEYPSTDEEQAVHVEIAYPDVKGDLNRWLPLVKWFLAIPHYIVLVFLSLAAVISTLIAWLIILFTGAYPRALFDFVVGVMRWSLRVQAYAVLLTTDQYPPFSLQA